jgi:hypothetical protein
MCGRHTSVILAARKLRLQDHKFKMKKKEEDEEEEEEEERK